jgi:hypothetical protein
MSATRDQNQKFKFIYANLYQIYRNERPQHSTPPVERSSGTVFGQIIKSADARAFQSYSPMEILKKPETPQVKISADTAVQGLRENLNKLNDLHARLRFMLKEIEELTR